MGHPPDGPADSRSGRPPLVIYRDESCLVRSLGGEECDRHPDGCPTEGEEGAEATEAATAEGPPLGFPILASKSVGGRTIHEVASLVKDQAREPIRPAEPPPDLRRHLKVVDVAFVIDTTASMQSTIDAARKLAADLVEGAPRAPGDVTLRLALVEYRDAARHYGFQARKVSSFAGPEGFLAAIGRINAANRGDGSVDESVLDGLALALPPGPEDPSRRARRLADRPAGELATSWSSSWEMPPTTTGTSTGPGPWPIARGRLESP